MKVYSDSEFTGSSLSMGNMFGSPPVVVAPDPPPRGGRNSALPSSSSSSPPRSAKRSCSRAAPVDTSAADRSPRGLPRMVSGHSRVAEARRPSRNQRSRGSAGAGTTTAPCRRSRTRSRSSTPTTAARPAADTPRRPHHSRLRRGDTSGRLCTTRELSHRFQARPSWRWGSSRQDANPFRRSLVQERSRLAASAIFGSRMRYVVNRPVAA
jgi:hypothetical protein